MAKPTKSEFKEIQDFWYQRLADEGFVDIENTNKKQDPFRIPHRHDNTFQNSQVWADSKKEYYELATDFLNEHTFATTMDKIIWEYHVNLITVRGISRLLAEVGMFLSKTTIHRKLIVLRELMKVKYNVTKSK